MNKKLGCFINCSGLDIKTFSSEVTHGSMDWRPLAFDTIALSTIATAGAIERAVRIAAPVSTSIRIGRGDRSCGGRAASGCMVQKTMTANTARSNWLYLTCSGHDAAVVKCQICVGELNAARSQRHQVQDAIHLHHQRHM